MYTIIRRKSNLFPPFHLKQFDSLSLTLSPHPSLDDNRPPTNLHKGREGRADHPPGAVEPDPFLAEERPLLVERDALSVARPLALEPAELAPRRDAPVAGDPRGERVAAHGVAHGARGRAEVRRQEAVGAEPARGDLAEEPPHALLEGRAVRGVDAAQLGPHVCCRGFCSRGGWG